MKRYVWFEFKKYLFSYKFVIYVLAYSFFLFLPLLVPFNLGSSHSSSIIQLWTISYNHSQTFFVVFTIINLFLCDLFLRDEEQKIDRWIYSRMGTIKYILSKIVLLVLISWIFILASNLIVGLILSFKYSWLPEDGNFYFLSTLSYGDLGFKFHPIIVWILLIGKIWSLSIIYLMIILIISLFVNERLLIVSCGLLVHLTFLMLNYLTVIPWKFKMLRIFSLYNYIEIDWRLDSTQTLKEWIIQNGNFAVTFLVLIAVLFIAYRVRYKK